MSDGADPMQRLRHWFEQCRRMTGCENKSGTCRCTDSFRKRLCLQREMDSSSNSPEVCSGKHGRKLRCCAQQCKRCKSLCIKSFLILVNLGCMICGWAMIGLGVWLHFNQNSFFFSHLLTNNPTNPIIVFESIPFIFLGVGLVVTITSFLGCCGACAESVCFLSFYAILLILMVGGEVATGIFINNSRQQFSHQMLASMQYQVQHQYNRTARHANHSALDIVRLTLAWDTLQIKMNCCGVLGPQDYLHTSWYNNTVDTAGIFVPSSCCVLENVNPIKVKVVNENYCQVEALLYTQKQRQNETLGYLHTQGCQPVVVRWLEFYFQKIVLFLSVLIIVQFVDFIFACILMSWVRKKQADYWWCEDDDCE